MYLGYETLFGTPGAGRGTLSSGCGGGNDPLTARATGKWLYRKCIYLFC